MIAQVRFLGQLFSDNILLVFKSIGFSLSQTLLLIASSSYIKVFVDGLQNGSGFGDLIFSLLITAALLLVSSIVGLAERRITLKVVKQAIFELRQNLFTRLLHSQKREFEKMDRSGLQQLIVQHTERVDVFSNAVISAVIPSMIILGTLSIYLFWLSWPLATLSLSVFPLLVIMIRIFFKPIHQLVEGFFEQMDRFNASVLFGLNHYDLIKISSSEKRQEKHFKANAKDLFEKSNHMAFFGFLYKVSQDYLTMISMLLILGFGGYLLSKELLEVGVLVSFCFTLLLMRRSQATLFGSHQHVIEGLRSLKRIERFLYDSKPAAPVPTEPKLGFRGQVRLEHLSFQYGEKELLKDVNLEIEPGKIVSLSGPNGSGKSTLLYLVCGLLHPKGGSLTIDGKNAQEVDMFSVRKEMGVVLQESHVFDGTIRENVAFDVTFTEETLQDCLALSTLDTVISAMPDGLDTVIGKGGVNVSRGQAQKIALCRALLRQPRLLILDEPTNHLDDLSVNHLLKNLQIVKRNCGILIISHNTDVEEIADYIYTLRDGKTILTPHYAKQETLTH